jgi:4-hydroxybenzoate polyprenyltransferase
MNSIARRPAALLWLDLARAGNFPSVASNVLAACAISAIGGISPSRLAASIVAGLLAYAGGATLNDAADSAFDSRHRPGRPIPSGLLARSTVACIGVMELGAGATLLLVLGANPLCVSSLVTLVALYNLVHKRWAGSVALIAGCRVALALAVATQPGHAPTAALGFWLLALWGYIGGLSVLARGEYSPGAPAARLGAAVRWMLACIPFVDSIALLVFGVWPWALVCASLMPLGRSAQRLLAAD